MRTSASRPADVGKFRRLGAILIFGAVVGLGAQVFAWGPTGHFYSTVAVMERRAKVRSGPVAKSEVLTALCSYLPDLSRELDAITLGVNAFTSGYGGTAVTWGLFDRCWGSSVRRMVVVQHYLHGLTGTDSSQVTAAARAVVTTLSASLRDSPSDPVRACALGFSFHLLGDSYAHRKVRHEDQMYGTGLGHFRDGSAPDAPLSSPARLAVWESYVIDLTKLTQVEAGPTKVQDLFDIGERLLPSVTGGGWDDFRMRVDLQRSITSDRAIAWFPFVPAVEDMERRALSQRLVASCDDILRYFAPGVAPAGLSCKEVWKAFLDAAVPAFSEVPPQCDGGDEVFE